MTSDKQLDLDAVKVDLAATQIDRRAGEVCCEGWWYATVRHVLRNMEMDCSIHGEYGDDPKPGRECGPVGRYDGGAFGTLLAAVPALVAEVERLRATLQRIRELCDDVTQHQVRRGYDAESALVMVSSVAQLLDADLDAGVQR